MLNGLSWKMDRLECFQDGCAKKCRLDISPTQLPGRVNKYLDDIHGTVAAWEKEEEEEEAETATYRCVFVLKEAAAHKKVMSELLKFSSTNLLCNFFFIIDLFFFPEQPFG